MAIQIVKKSGISYPADERYIEQTTPNNAFDFLPSDPGKRGNFLGDVEAPSVIPGTAQKTKSNITVVGTRVAYAHASPGVRDLRRGMLVFVRGRPPRSNSTLANYAVPLWSAHGPVSEVAGQEHVNSLLRDTYMMQSWRLDGVLLTVDRDETLPTSLSRRRHRGHGPIQEDDLETTTLALLVSFQGPTLINNIFAHKLTVQDVVYMALVYRSGDATTANSFVWKPCSSEFFIDDDRAAYTRYRMQGTLSVDDTPFIVGAYKVGQVMEASTMSVCKVNVDIGWVSVAALRLLHGPSRLRLSNSVISMEEWDRYQSFFIGRSPRVKHIVLDGGRRTVGPGYTKSTNGFGGTPHTLSGGGSFMSTLLHTVHNPPPPPPMTPPILPPPPPPPLLPPPPPPTMPPLSNEGGGGKSTDDPKKHFDIANAMGHGISFEAKYTDVKNEDSIPNLINKIYTSKNNETQYEGGTDLVSRYITTLAESNYDINKILPAGTADHGNKKLEIQNKLDGSSKELKTELQRYAPLVNRALYLVCQIVTGEHIPTANDLKILSTVMTEIVTVQYKHVSMFNEMTNILNHETWQNDIFEATLLCQFARHAMLIQRLVKILHYGRI